MKFLLVAASLMLATTSIPHRYTPAPATAVHRSDPVLVRAVIDGDTVDVAAIGRVYVDFSIVDVEVNIRTPRDGVGLSPLIGMGDESGEREDKRQHVR